ncbi:MAG TPA: crossover junction endodeoxyribonuclease RuvC [Candidatus Akkermansia intestinigallinarum]|uniref:Crossover junction endodeoxyribonuclease RuvC n=1 Tax=Candidatus Akkermansia intestinigallinarum TaxID=2838431 RepID=A0A9D1V9K8_9BACT|nr:crossover junction endodeoxyribonuclease RuvC [Candidatus Akkermansia intestinigallinarum]
MRVVSIDPAIRNTGYAVLEGDYREARALEYGTLSLPASMPQSSCLRAIHEQVCSLIRRWQPDELAIEAIIYVQSHRTAISMGSARGASVLAAALHDLPIVEYPPGCVKLATVGKGRAVKQQVAFMMRAMLRLTETPAPDAADALAVGYTHLAATDPTRAKLFSERKII